jgi:hypothetical protein
MSLVDRTARAADLYRRTTASRSALVLVVANAIPLVGVLFFGWSLWTILVLYWLENGIVGFWNICRILVARNSFLPGLPVMPSGFASAGRIAIATFFSFHYGIFWLVHGLFVFLLPMFAGLGSAIGSSPFGQVVWSSVALGGVALFVSHGASFVFNYLGRGEYLRMSPVGLLFAPYGRVVVLHLTILFGAFFAVFLGAPIALLVILVVLKTVLDLRFHLAERVRFGEATAPAEAAT